MTRGSPGISHCFGGPQVLQISWNPAVLTKQWEISTAHDYKKTLKKFKNNFNPETLIFVKPVARQNSGIYTLRIIKKVASRNVL